MTPNIFSKFEKVKDSPEILLIRKHNSSQRGETFSHSQNKCKIVSGKFITKITVGRIGSTNSMEKLISTDCLMKKFKIKRPHIVLNIFNRFVNKSIETLRILHLNERHVNLIPI